MTSLIHYSTMRKRVLKGSSWTFNNYLLMLYHLRKGEDPLKKGDLNLLSQWNGGSSMEKGQSEMDHDFKDSVMVGPMGKRDLKGRKTNPKWWMSWEFGSPRAVRRLRYMLKLHNPQVVFFIEMKLCSIQMERVRRSYGFFNGIDVQTIGSRGGLCLAWKDDVKIGLRNFSNSHINVDVIEDEIGSQLASGDLLNKLETLKKGLVEWAIWVKHHKEGIKKISTNKLEDLNHGERDDENQAELIDIKILLNFEMEKEEMYWEQ
ncbi:hypothetical protein Godav_004054, partial [Gossypium davidsonii]|nr:hypothetical protein [Gossypium davidsonii]